MRIRTPFDEMCVTSPAKVSVPSICDFLQVSFNSAACIPDLIRSQSGLGREFDARFDQTSFFVTIVAVIAVMWIESTNRNARPMQSGPPE